MYLLFIQYMGRYVFIWMGAFEGVGPEIETFLGPEMATSPASAIWAQKSQLFAALIESYLFKGTQEWDENFFGSDFEFCTISLLVMFKYQGF